MLICLTANSQEVPTGQGYATAWRGAIEVVGKFNHYFCQQPIDDEPGYPQRYGNSEEPHETGGQNLIRIAPSQRDCSPSSWASKPQRAERSGSWGVIACWLSGDRSSGQVWDAA